MESDGLIRTRLSGHVLDVNSKSQSEGANVLQWIETGNGNQEWYFRKP